MSQNTKVQSALNRLFELLNKAQAEHPSAYLDEALDLLPAISPSPHILNTAIGKTTTIAVLDIEDDPPAIDGEGETKGTHAADLHLLANELDPTLVSTIVNQQSVTDQRNVQRELEQTMKAINESAIVGITDTYGRIIHANQNFCDISGYSRDELLGKTHRIVNSGFHPKKFFIEMWTSLLAGKVWRGEIQNKTKNGRYYWVSTVIFPVRDLSGHVVKFIAIRFDITIQKTIQQKLVQSAKMSPLGEMAAGIAHEVNNPLAIISGNVSRLKTLISTGRIDPDKFLKNLSHIEDTITRITKIIKGLKSFSRNSENDPMTPTLISQIVEDSLQLCRERLKYHGVALRVSCPENLPFECRPEQISQILINLLGNSFDAVESLDKKWVELEITHSQDKLRISVRDSGSGIPQQVADKIMQPFFTTKAIGKGTGLGLSISKGLIEDHHGILIYDSESENTHFIVELPLKQPNSR